MSSARDMRAMLTVPWPGACSVRPETWAAASTRRRQLNA
jgi:hypothetical protein